MLMIRIQEDGEEWQDLSGHDRDELFTSFMNWTTFLCEDDLKDITDDDECPPQWRISYDDFEKLFSSDVPAALKLYRDFNNWQGACDHVELEYTSDMSIFTRIV